MDVRCVHIAGEHVGDAVVIGVDDHVHIFRVGQIAVGPDVAGLAGQGVGATVDVVRDVVMDAGQKSDGRAAGNDFAGLNGAEAAFRAIEDGPGDLGFEALVGTGGRQSKAISLPMWFPGNSMLMKPTQISCP